MTIPNFLSELRDGADGVTWVSLGDLHLPTGQIVACDPLVAPDTSAFVVTVPPGDYPVFVGLQGQKKMAYSVLQITDAPSTEWKVAYCPYEEETLPQGEVPGYPIDTGTGALMDQAAADVLISLHNERLKRFNELLQEHKNEETAWNLVDQQIPDLLSKLYAHGFGKNAHANLQLEPDQTPNLVAFKLMLQQVTLPSYWGFDAAGKVTRLVTDFLVLEELPENRPQETDDDDEAELDLSVLEALSALTQEEAPEEQPENEEIETAALQSAIKFIHLLLEGELLELTPGANLETIARGLAPFLDAPMSGYKKARLVTDWILDQDQVEELYISDDDLTRLLDRW